MCAALQISGFTTLEYRDLNRDSMIYLINKWQLSLDTYDVAVFYFSGHGVVADGVDYLVPTDGKFYTDVDIRDQGYNVNKLIDRLVSTHSEKIVLLDACRGQLDRSEVRHFDDQNKLKISQMNGIFVGFATAPGEIAFSGPKDSLSFYTGAIINNLNKAISLEELFSKVEREVTTLTGRKQIPQKRSTLGIDIFLGPSLAEE